MSVCVCVSVSVCVCVCSVCVLGSVGAINFDLVAAIVLLCAIVRLSSPVCLLASASATEIAIEPVDRVWTGEGGGKEWKTVACLVFVPARPLN